MTAPVGRHPHHLGSWAITSVVSVRPAGGSWRQPTPDEQPSLVAADGSLASVFTLPSWPLRELDTIDWSDGTPEGTAVETAQFARYSARVLELLRFVGIPLADRCDVKLVATKDRGADLPSGGTVGAGVTDGAGDKDGAVVANVGETPLRVILGAASDALRTVAVVLGPGEGCVLSPAARPWSVALAADAEFGLHLETATLGG